MEPEHIRRVIGLVIFAFSVLVIAIVKVERARFSLVTCALGFVLMLL